MLNFNLFFKIYIILYFIVLNACSPFSEEKLQNSVVELEFIDSSLQQNALNSNSFVVGNLFLEIQEDLISQRKTLVAKATFHNSTSRNILFPDVFSGVLEKNIYEPIAEEDPCGIPGYSDCPSIKKSKFILD